MPKKVSTEKDYRERMNRVFVYIQQHCHEALSLETLAGVAHFSVYHFHRIFQAYTNETLSSYIRRLRLQRAAAELVYTKQTITEVALEAGFDTPSSFSKAFKQLLGESPSTVRKQGGLGGYHNPYVTIEPMNEEFKMNVEIKTIPEQTVLFVQRTGSYFESAPAAWQAIMSYVHENNINIDNCYRLGVCHDDPAVVSDDKCRFQACIAGLDNPTADGDVGVQTVAGGKYAVFEHIGAFENLGDTYRYAFGQWLPHSGETLRDVPAFNKYESLGNKRYLDLSDAEKAVQVTKVYVPLV